MKFVIEHLSKSFEKKEVLRDIDFTFDEGKIYGLLGRNGVGKTTLFNCLNRDLKADSGNFYIEDENGSAVRWPQRISDMYCLLPRYEKQNANAHQYHRSAEYSAAGRAFDIP